jgi:hypothetical protein
MPVYKTIDKNYFKTWSHDMAYVLGFMAADGTITKTGRGTAFFSIAITDYKLLASIRSSFRSNHTISVRVRKEPNQKPLYRLQIGSKEIVNDLEKLGFTTRKTHSLLFPSVPKKYIGAFVRGYFDGDGNVWVGERKDRKSGLYSIQTTFTSCSKGFLTSLATEVNAIGGVKGSLSKKKGNAFKLSYSSRGSLFLYKMMYNRGTLSGGLFLPRKKKIFEEFLERSQKKTTYMRP